MKKILFSLGIVILILLIFFFVMSARDGIYRKAVDKKCAETDFIIGQGFSVTGFTYDEVKNILVKEFNNNILIDSFTIQAIEFPYDSIRKRYEAIIEKKINIKSVYKFYIKKQEPYILSNITLMPQTHRSMFSEVYGCDIESYELNGKIYKNSGHFDLKKIGYKFPWEK